MVIVNGKMNGKHSIRFESVAGESTAEPCFKLDQLDALGLRIELNGSTKIASDVKDAAKDQCYNLKDLIKDSSTRYNSGDFELSITVPQFNLVKHPRGYISPSLWDAGAPVGFWIITAMFMAFLTVIEMSDQSRILITPTLA